MKRILFIDRDGTLIKEPADEQVDDFAKLQFVEGMLSSLSFVCQHTDFELVMVTNQDGLGTPSFPEETFWPVHRFLIETLRGEGIVFSEELIDRHFPEDNAPTRKPGTGMVEKYMNSEEYDLAGSYVIGDRETDAQLARNMGCRALILGRDGLTWKKIAELLFAGERRAEVRRVTGETDIYVGLGLDGTGRCDIHTGLGFFDHMLEQIPHHGGISLNIKAEGDLEVDEHHTMEDVGIVLGEALFRALGTKAGIERYGFVLPMDECEAMVLIDLGGRIDFRWDVEFTREYVGDVPTEMFRHFFQSVCNNARCNLHIKATGENNHHKAEAVFKAFARALRMAVSRSRFPYELPSSKGLI